MSLYEMKFLFVGSKENSPERSSTAGTKRCQSFSGLLKATAPRTIAVTLRREQLRLHRAANNCGYHDDDCDVTRALCRRLTGYFRFIKTIIMAAVHCVRI